MQTTVVLCLILSAAVAAFGAGTNGLQAEDFASAETCKPCHTEIYQQWRSSFHSQAATDSVFWKLFRQAVKDAGSRASMLCLTCHAPVATVGREIRWYGPVSDELELSPVAKEGVTCDFCHTISGEENLGKKVTVGAYRLPRNGDTAIKYGSHPDARTSAHATQPSAFLGSAQLCAICHQYTHPLPGLELQNTYSEWYYGPYRAQGRKCQDCHMPAYRGRAAEGGPERPDINAHVFQGGHTRMLYRSVTVSLGTRVREKSGARQISVNARVTNAGSGHLIPTGIPGIRQLWLDLRVASEDGAEVFAGREDYGVTLLDKDGNPAMPWKAVRVGTDTRIAPQKSRRKTFRFTIPDSKSEALKVNATVYYRLISEQAARSAGIEPSAPIEVASDQILISSERRVKKASVR